MSQVLAHAAQTADGVVIDLGGGDTLTLTGVALDDLGAANFTGIQAGAPIIHIAAGTSAAELNQIIADAGKGATIILEAGTHVFTEAIRIDNDGVTLRGVSETDTTIVFDFPAGTGSNGIEVMGGGKTFVGSATTDIARAPPA